MIIEALINNLTWNKKMEVLRRINNLTQEEVAEKCNTNQKMYWLWEKGKNYPRKTSKELIAKALNVSVEDIFL